MGGSARELFLSPPAGAAPLRPPAQLISLATASPPHVFEQTAVGEAARAIFADRYRDFERLFPVFQNTGIQRRQAARPMEWYFEQHSWPERSAAYLTGALELFIDAARSALARAGVEAAEVDTIVTVSSTGIATPVSYTHLDVYKRQGLIRLGGVTPARLISSSRINWSSASAASPQGLGQCGVA